MSTYFLVPRIFTWTTFLRQQWNHQRVRVLELRARVWGPVMRDQLERVREWANETMADDSLPGWAWYEVAKLKSNLDSVLVRVGPIVFEGQRDPEHPSTR
jgi:hypothetical protein